MIGTRQRDPTEIVQNGSIASFATWKWTFESHKDKLDQNRQQERKR